MKKKLALAALTALLTLALATMPALAHARCAGAPLIAGVACARACRALTPRADLCPLCGEAREEGVCPRGCGYVDADGDGLCDHRGAAHSHRAERGHHGRHGSCR